MSENPTGGQPQARYASGYTETRLKFQEGRRAATHAAFLLPRLQPHLRLLDCGCGTGSITNDLALAVPQGFVIGVDSKATQCRLARLAARQARLNNVFYEQQDVLDLEFSDDTFDIVFGHAILDHVADIDLAMRQMLRVLKPGGLLALRSPDWTRLRIAPNSATTDRCMRLYQALIDACGGNSRAGHEIVAGLARLEVRDIEVTTSSERHFHPGKSPALLADVIAEILANAVVPVPGATPGEIALNCAEMKSWAANSGAEIEEFWIEVLAIKPMRLPADD